MSKAGSLAERKLESSMDHSNSAKFRAGRLRLKMRMLSHLATSTIASQPSYVAYENTYKMVSDEGKQFSIKKAEEVCIIRDTCYRFSEPLRFSGYNMTTPHTFNYFLLLLLLLFQK